MTTTPATVDGVPFVKVCGLSEPESLRAAVDSGAHAVGFVLTDSPRQVAPDTVRRLVDQVPDHVLTVAVVGSEPTDVVRRLAVESGVSAVQLHGDHPPEHFAALADLGLTLVRATSLPPDTTEGERRNPLTAGDFGDDLLIVDSPRGGSGQTWDWAALPPAARPRGRWLLAGGLTPDNVAAALAGSGAWGVDVSSGVERSRGVKDPERVRRFVRRALSVPVAQPAVGHPAPPAPPAP